MILLNDGNYRLFGATLAVEIVPLSIPDRWILQINGQSSSDVALVGSQVTWRVMEQ